MLSFWIGWLSDLYTGHWILFLSILIRCLKLPWRLPRSSLYTFLWQKNDMWSFLSLDFFWVIVLFYFCPQILVEILTFKWPTKIYGSLVWSSVFFKCHLFSCTKLGKWKGRCHIYSLHRNIWTLLFISVVFICVNKCTKLGISYSFVFIHISTEY